MTATEPDGTGAFSCMENALKKANVAPSEIGYINAHATSTPMGILVSKNFNIR